MTSGPDPGEFPGFWGSMVFRHAPIPRKGSGKQQQQQQHDDDDIVIFDVVAIALNSCYTILSIVVNLIDTYSSFAFANYA